MTTFGFIIMLLGAGAFSAGVVRLADWIDQPHPRRRTAWPMRLNMMQPAPPAAFAGAPARV